MIVDQILLASLKKKVAISAEFIATLSAPAFKTDCIINRFIPPPTINGIKLALCSV